MKCLWAGAIGLSLACWLASVAAQEPQWRPATASPITSAGVTLGRPIVYAESDEPTTVPSSGIMLASYAGAEPVTLIRAQTADEGSSFAVDSYPSSAPAPKSAPADSHPSSGPIHTFLAALSAPTAPSPSNVAPVPAQQSKPVTSTVAAPGCGGLGDGCDPACCDNICSDPCCSQRGRLYGSAEYLLWWIRPGNAPPLVTTGPATLPVGQQGVLGVPGNTTIFGGPLDYGTFSGGRLTFGYWFDPCETCAIEGRFFFLGQNSLQFGAGSPGYAVVGRPFFNENFNVPGAELAVSPGIGAGQVLVNSASQLWGAEANLRKNICSGCWGRWDLFGGVRFLDLTESLTINENVMALANSMSVSPIAPGSLISNFDSFRTENQFYGGQLGTELELHKGKWFTDLRGALAAGDMHEVVEINGGTALFPPTGGVQLAQGALLALPSNIGRFTRERFAVVPELGINVGYQFTENFRVFVGYTALYASNVVRPGDQIDTVLDVRQVPFAGQPIPPVSQVRPLLPFKSSDLWVHGVNFGFELRY